MRYHQIKDKQTQLMESITNDTSNSKSIELQIVFTVETGSIAQLDKLAKQAEIYTSFMYQRHDEVKKDGTPEKRVDSNQRVRIT